MLLASSSAWLSLLFFFFPLSLFLALSPSRALSLCAKCKAEVQPDWRRGRGEFSSFLLFFKKSKIAKSWGKTRQGAKGGGGGQADKQPELQLEDEKRF